MSMQHSATWQTGSQRVRAGDTLQHTTVLQGRTFARHSNFVEFWVGPFI